LLEAFRDADAGREHVQSEHFKKAIRDTPPLLVETPEIVNVEVPGTEWAKLTEMAVPGDR
jgi:quinol monooxygenase YgiN